MKLKPPSFLSSIPRHWAPTLFVPLFILIDPGAGSTDWLVFYGVEVLGAFKCFLAFRADKTFYMPLLVKGPQRPVCYWFPATSALWKNRVCVAVITVRLSLSLPVAHWCSELGKAAKADKMFWVPGLVHCTNAIWSDEVLAFGTSRDKLLLVTLVAVQPVLLGVDRHILQTSLAATADKVMLVIVLVFCFHGPVCNRLLTTGAGHCISHPLW